MAVPVFRIPVWNYGLWRQPYLAQFLNQPVKMSLLPSHSSQESAWLCWGAKPSARHATWYAAQSKEPLLRLEDGFLRSCGLGVDGHAPLSLVVDDLGIYYDATRPSRLETLIASADPDADALAQARRAIGLIRRHRLSKYNHAPELDLPALVSRYRSRVLVVDQTMGDVSVRLGGANAEVFASSGTGWHPGRDQKFSVSLGHRCICALRLQTGRDCAKRRQGAAGTGSWFCLRRRSSRRRRCDASAGRVEVQG